MACACLRVVDFTMKGPSFTTHTRTRDVYTNVYGDFLNLDIIIHVQVRLVGVPGAYESERSRTRLPIL